MHNRDEGFTLVEVVVSLALFAILATAATTAIVGAIRASYATELRVAAHLIAQQELDRVLALGSNPDLSAVTLPTDAAPGADGYRPGDGTLSASHSSDGASFRTVTTTAPAWDTACSIVGTAHPYRDITVEVSVQSARIAPLYLDTRIACQQEVAP